MAVLRKKSFAENLETFSVLVNDTAENSTYFKITDLPDTFTGGKNSFLIQGSTDLVQDTIVKVEIKDSTGEVIYSEAGEGIPEYYEGTSKPVAVYVYPDTPYGPCTITILAELAEYTNERGVKTGVPAEWRGKYNIRWQKTVNVNPNLVNTSKIRFYRRPKANITETILPVYNRSVSRRTISGSINGSAVQPSVGSNFRTFNGDTVYTLYTTSSVFSSSMEGERITINGLNQSYSTTVFDVVNGSKLLATIPYYETSSNLVSSLQIVKNFENGQFTLSYNDSVALANSTLNASYARIKLTDLEAFSGDPARLKVFSKRKADIGNFSLIDDVRLESSEIFITASYSGSINVNTGRFINQTLIDDFWKYTDVTGNSYNASYDNTTLAASVKLEENGIKNSSDYPTRIFYYKTELDFNANTEYELDFTPLLSSSLYTPTKLEVYGSGSAFISDNTVTQLGKKITSFNFDGTFRRYDSQQVIFKPDRDGTGTIVFAVYQGNWHLSNITLKASSETNFSPNEITLNVSVPTVVNNDEYEFRFEFYDVNNNYVPVTVVTSSVFTGGTTLEDISATAQFLRVAPDSNVFPFGYLNNYDFQEVNTFTSVPIGTTQINFNIQASGLTGSVTFTSAAFDSGGLYIDPNTYVGQYPGFLTNITTSSATLDVANFTGSMASTIEVKRITYTASLDGFQDIISIYKVVEGTPGSDGTNGTNYVVRPLNGTAIKNSNPNVYLEVQVTKIDGNTNTYDLSSGNVKLTTGSGVNPPVLAASSVVVAGANGVEYNARFYAGAINGSLTVSAYDYDQQVIVDTITLADVTDGLTTGFIEASNGLILNRDPSTNLYTPSDTAFTASFFDSLGNIYSASLLITPNYSSVDRLKYETGYSDSNITLEYVKTNAGVAMANNTYYNTTGLTAKYNFTEPNTGVTVSATEGVVITTNGSSGTSGAAGSNGSNGTSGANGTSGTSGDAGEAAVVVSVTPATQTTNVTTAGMYSAPSNITISAIQSGTNFTYDNSSPYGNGTFYITNVVGGTNNNNGTITPTTPSTTAGITTTFDVVYTSLIGTTATVSQTHIVSVALVGQTGPGIVFTGPWESGRAYQYSDTRRDAVISGSENRYYATLQQHTANSSNAPSNGTDNAYWQYLGQEDFFVAAKIAIFRESYVQNTLNVGTTNNGGISSANITLYGATEYPYISIGQSSATGSQGYAVGAGIFIGRDKNDGGYKASFEGVSGHLRWNGSSLDIRGGITATSGSIQNILTIGGNGSAGTGITLDGANSKIYIGAGNYNNTDTAFYVDSTGQFSLKDKLTWNGSTLTINGGGTFSGGLSAASGTFVGKITAGGMSLGNDVNGTNDGIYIDANDYWYSDGTFSLGNGNVTWNGSTLSVTGVINIVAGGNAATTTNVTNAVLSGSVSASNAAASASISGSNALLAAQNAAASASLSGSVAPNTQRITKNAAPDGTGLYLGANNLGYYDAGVWKTYMSSSGNFYLTGSSDQWLEWNAATGLLQIAGAINIRPGGNAATTTDASNAVTSGSLYANNAVLSGSVSASNAAASASLSGSVNPTTQQLVKNASPSGTGLYLGANNLGYYNDGAWATYMSSSGDFFLSGSTGNYLEWISTLGTLNIRGAISASAGAIGGWNIINNNLFSSNLSMSFNAGDASIRLGSGSNDTTTVVIRPGELSARSTNTETPTLNEATTTSNTYSTTQTIGPFNGTSSNFTILSSEEGTYSAILTCNGLTTNDTIATKSGFAGSFSVSLKIQIARDSGFTDLIYDTGIGSGNYYGTTSSTDVTFFYTTNTPITLNLTAGTYYVRLQWVGSIVRSAGSVTLNARTSVTDSPLSFGLAVAQTEITDGGFQVLRSSTRYVTINRSGTSNTMLEVGGDITATGNITAFYSPPSDVRFKENIIPIDSALDKVEKINGVYFDWKEDYLKKLWGNNPIILTNAIIKKHDVGFIAQEVEEVVPELVTTDTDGYKGIKYDKIVALLVESIKELKKEIDILKGNI
jgi:hypothetical protein